jgi:hypothetical protein
MTLQSDWTWVSHGSATTSLRFLTEHDGGWPSVTATFRVLSPTEGLVVTMPDGSTQEVPAGVPTDLSWTGAIQQSGSEITIATASGNPASIYVSMLSAEPVPDAQSTACITAWEEQVAGEG